MMIKVSNKSENIRHILALSGGKDSAALAVYLRGKIPDLEYVFLDTGHELPETYEFLNRMRAVLGIEIKTLSSKRDFDFFLGIFRGCLPSPQNRWCTRQLKIVPYEHYIGSGRTNSYIAIRADENRTGYISHSPNIIPFYPFIEDGLSKADIISILEDSGLGLPKYYSWRSRSGCYFCFFQRRSEWIGLYDNHPNLFYKACEYETNHDDGREYTWVEGISLSELLKRRESILTEAEHVTARNLRIRAKKRGKKLSESLAGLSYLVENESVISNDIINNTESADENDDNQPCLICTL